MRVFRGFHQFSEKVLLTISGVGLKICSLRQRVICGQYQIKSESEDGVLINLEQKRVTRVYVTYL